MYDLSEAFVALPGGWGTLEEIFEILTWAQLGLHRKPCGFLNVDGFFDPLLKFFDEMIAEGFVKEKYRGLMILSRDPRELLRSFAAFKAPRAEPWLKEGET